MVAPLPPRDVLAVTIGAGGVRARRTGRADAGGPAASDSTIEVPEASLAAPRDAGEAGRLVAAVAALTERFGAAPEASVWAVPEDWHGGPAADLLAAIRAQTPGGRTLVVAHAVATHAGALGGVRPGTCLDVGAGAAALATDVAGTWHRLDGWGPLLGGRGSGAWIGAQGLAAGLRWRDGVPGGSAVLLEAGRAAFGAETTWPARFAGRGANENEDVEVGLVAFVPAVAEAAHGCPVARAILRAAGEALADTLLAGRRLLPDAPLVVVGGLLYVEGVRVALAAALGQRQAFLVPGLGGALEGARLLGEHVLAGGALPHHPPYVVLDTPGELPA